MMQQDSFLKSPTIVEADDGVDAAGADVVAVDVEVDVAVAVDFAVAVTVDVAVVDDVRRFDGALF